MGIYVKQNRIFNNRVRYNLYPINASIITNHINNSIVNKLVGKSASEKYCFSSSFPYGGVGDAGVWVRNTNCWLNGVDNISCFSPAQRSGAAWHQRGGTLITKKHFILAKHFTFALLDGGTPIIFVDENNNAIKRNLVQYAFDNLTDIAIGLLDNEVPDNIKIAKVLPPNYGEFINNPVLAVSIDQQKNAIVSVWQGLLNYIHGNENYKYAYITQLFNNSYYLPQYSEYSSFSESIVTGDSGQPAFIIIDNTLVLLSCWTTPISGPFITNRYNKVNELIESLSPNEGYNLTPVDLNAVYNKYT